MAGKRLFVVFLTCWAWVVAFLADSPQVRADGLPDRQVRLLCRDGYLPGIPILVRVELVAADGRVDRGIWDAAATLSVDSPAVSLDTEQIVLRNGLGSALVTISGSGDFTLTAAVAGLYASRGLTDWQNEPVQTAALSAGDHTSWSGIVQVNSDVIVPAGHTLTFQPGTLILLKGVSSGTGGADIIVRGVLESLGTMAEPVTLTSQDPEKAWGRIFHDHASPSVYQFSHITRSGHAPSVSGHTGAPPAVYALDSQISFSQCGLTDHDGKIMSADGSDLTFRGCHLARAVMGPEIATSALLFEDGHITEMFGSDDNDGIYLHRQLDGQTMCLRRTVIAAGDDDGLDTLDAIVRVEDCIIRDFFDKGVSVNQSRPIWLDHLLLVNNEIGVAAKNVNPRVYMDHVTIVCRDTGADKGIYAYEKDDPDAIVEFFVSNCIAVADEPVASDFVPAGAIDPLIHIQYTLLAGGSWPGLGNLNRDPLFADPGGGDFHLRSAAGRWDPVDQLWLIDPETSVAIDAGNPGCPLESEAAEPANVRVNMGYYGATAQASRTPVGWSLRADLNNDGRVDAFDAACWSAAWRISGQDIPADLDRSGAVGLADLQLLADDWLQRGDGLYH
ncbi:MAG: hypothetical protein JW810_02720 [Sedimentisphaerales bacterium]|nr:hypothetical protein [Sedimentisphaerales bacterium]